MINQTLLLNDALKIFYGKYPNFKVTKVIYYEQLFLFDSVARDEEEIPNLTNSLISVDKLSGKIMGFNPLMCDRQKYLIAVSKAVSL